MVVYADVLICINTIVDYFLIRTTQFFSSGKISTARLLISSIIGGLSSLYIFLESSSFLGEFIFKTIICFIISAICYGIKNIKKLLFGVVLLLCVTCAYTGFMFAIWFLFKPNGMLINNSVIYFDISPITVIVFTVVFYIVFTLLNLIFKREAVTSKRCKISVSALGKNTSFTAIIDSGNSIVDNLSNSEIIVADKRHISELFGETYGNEKLKNRYRKIPCSTVMGSSLLDGYRCDFAVATTESKQIKLERPILAVSQSDFNDDYTAIINPRIFT